MQDQTGTPSAIAAEAADKQEPPHDDSGWTDHLGRRAGDVYYDRLGHRRVVTPPKFYTDDGTLVATGAEATAAFDAHLDEVQEHNRQVLARLKPHELARFETWLRTRTRVTPPTRPSSRPARSGPVNGRSPREARNDRRRGSRRGQRATSATRDGPDDDGESSEPPPGGRLCRCGCQASLAHKAPQARYLNDTHAATDRQRRKRERDNAPSEDDIRLASVRCGCKPKRNPLEPGWCHQCGHPRDGVPVAWVPAGPRSKQLLMRDLARRKWRTGDGKRRPLTVIEGRTA
jgi:hypothetical protein